MHADFRVSFVDRVCAFDAESFVRMHQLMDGCVGGTTSTCEHLVTLSRKTRSADAVFRPVIKVQFAFENLAHIETNSIFLNLERHQHKKQEESNWDGSEITTKRYRGQFQEAIIASLPERVLERNLKVRVLQLAPELSKTDSNLVRSIYPAYFQKKDLSLCLGVAKVKLRELILTKSGVCVSLQPKQSMISVVEARNLNTVVTNSMFGRDEGGIAILTFQVASHTFTHKAISSILWLSQTSLVDQKKSVNHGSLAVVKYSAKEHVEDVAHLEELRMQMATPAVRFALIPYMVCLDRLLHLNDVVSWCRPVKTFLLLCIVLLVLLADFGAIGFSLAVLFECVASLRIFLFFYSGPLHQQQQQLRPEAILHGRHGRKDNFHAVLYGHDNIILNSMMRARLFFAQEMQVDCYLEFVYIVNRLRRARRWVLPCLAVALLIFFLFSPETLVLWVVLGAFVVYPVRMRLSFLQLRRKWSHQVSSGTLWKAISLCQPMPVSLIVNIGEALGEAKDEHSILTSPWLPMSAETFPLPAGNSSAKEEARLREHSLHPTPPGSTGHSRSTRGSRKEEAVLPPADLLSISRVQSVATAEDGPLLNSVSNNVGAGLSGGVPRSVVGEGGLVSSRQTPKLFFALLSVTSVDQQGGTVTSSRGASMSTSPGLGTGGQVQLARRMRRLMQRVRLLERLPQPRNNELREHYFSYFNSILAFLQFVRQKCALEVYLSPPPPGCESVLRLDQFARAPWLVEKGEDDGVTSTLIKHSFQQVSVGRLQPLDNFDNSARVFALFSSYLLQGTRLSLYTGAGSRGCAVILPLRIGTLDMEMAPEPNPCPPSLQQALVGFWKGWTEGESSIEITTDVVLKVIETYKYTWSGESPLAVAGQSGYQHSLLNLQEDPETARATSRRLLNTFKTPSVSRQHMSNSGIIRDSSLQQLPTPQEKKQKQSGTSAAENWHLRSLSGTDALQKKFSVHRSINSWAYSGGNSNTTYPCNLARVSSSVLDFDNNVDNNALRSTDSDPPFASQTYNRKESLQSIADKEKKEENKIQ